MLRDLSFTNVDGEQIAFMNGTHGEDDGDRVVPSAPAVDPLDDVFGSEQSSPRSDITSGEQGSAEGTSQGRSSDPSDIPRLRSRHVTEGYREGVAESKDRYIQTGFDEGYSLGAEIGLLAGWCLGVLEGICRALATKAGNSDVSADDLKAAREMHGEVYTLLRAAREQLVMARLFGAEYFDGDGVWTYELPGQELDQAEILFRDVAAAHPLLQKWTIAAHDIAKRTGVALP